MGPIDLVGDGASDPTPATPSQLSEA
jgi:hypothetical protein